MSRRTVLILLLLIIIIGVGIRTYQLTARSLWFDEAFSWRLIQFSFSEMFARGATDVHPLLYYVLLKSWRYVFASSLLSLRLFSTTFAGLTIAAGYLFTNYVTKSRSAGLISAILIAFSGFQIQFSWEARMYTLGTSLALLSSWLLLKALRVTTHRDAKWLTKNGSEFWLAYSVTAAAFVYVHYYAFFSIAAQAIFVFGYILVATRLHIMEIIQSRLTWLAIASFILLVIFFSPWLPTFLQQNSQVQEAYWIPSIGGWSIPDTFYRMFAPTPGIPQHQGLGWILLTSLPIAATLIGWLWLAISHRKNSDYDGAWLIILSGLIPFLLSIVLSMFGQSLYQDRFFVFAHLFIVIGLAMLIARLRPTWLKTIVAGFAALAFLTAFISFWQQIDVASKPGAHAAVDTIYQQLKPNDRVIASSPFIYFSILHYAQEDYPKLTTPTTPKLYSETGELAHFAGGPILTKQDVIGPEIFSDSPDALWVVDTTGFGASSLQLPTGWQSTYTHSFPEVFAHQGEVIVTKYIQN